MRMHFEESRAAETIGIGIGFIFSYALFTAILFFLLSLLHKLPGSWTFYHIAGMTVVFIAVCLGVERLIK